MDKSIRFCVCDDDSYFTSKIVNIIKNVVDNNRNIEITVFDNGDDLLEYCDKTRVDAIFLDIDMPFMTGFDVADTLQKYKDNILIVFITSHEDKVYQSWSYQPFWFVRKSCLSDLEIVIPKLTAKIDYENKKKNCFHKFKTEKSLIELDINALTVIESIRHDIIIKYREGKEQQVRCKICDAENQLRDLDIVRVQNGILVNCRYISKVTSREVVLLNGDRINLSRKRNEIVRDVFQRFMRSF